MRRRGFSLLETLIATGVLIVVVMGVMSLSNSLIVGTVVNADKTIINRWASEGIELTQKIRDDRILNKNTSPKWFAPAIEDRGDDYGWYKLITTDNKAWKLSDNKVADGTVGSQAFIDFGESLTSDKTTGYRLICVEAVGSSVVSDADQFNCNIRDRSLVKDGARTELETCQFNVGGQYDLYCNMTQTSINKNSLGSEKIIPPGNAVKIRSVVIWQDKSEYRSSSIATLITNWKGYDQ